MKEKRLSDSLLLSMRRALFNAARRRNPLLDPRRWSNVQLRRIAPHFGGDVVNVSGWRDEDKEGATYRSYFKNADSYTITNYVGTSQADDGVAGSAFLNLEADLPPEFERRYDVAFSHTVLEHIGNVGLAIKNIAGMTRDAAIVVVPFMQQEHYTGELYGDLWRFTPLGLKRLLESNGLTLVYLASNDNPWYPIYLLAFASRQPARWATCFPKVYNWSSRIGMSSYIYPGCVR